MVAVQVRINSRVFASGRARASAWEVASTDRSSDGELRSLVSKEVVVARVDVLDERDELWVHEERVVVGKRGRAALVREGRRQVEAKVVRAEQRGEVLLHVLELADEVAAVAALAGVAREEGVLRAEVDGRVLPGAERREVAKVRLRAAREAAPDEEAREVDRLDGLAVGLGLLVAREDVREGREEALERVAHECELEERPDAAVELRRKVQAGDFPAEVAISLNSSKAQLWAKVVELTKEMEWLKAQLGELQQLEAENMALKIARSNVEGRRVSS